MKNGVKWMHKKGIKPELLYCLKKNQNNSLSQANQNQTIIFQVMYMLLLKYKSLTKSFLAGNSSNPIQSIGENHYCVFHLYAVDTQDTANNVINFLQLPHKGFICTLGI